MIRWCSKKYQKTSEKLQKLGRKYLVCLDFMGFE
jgi:hypothetical protein